MLNKIIFIDDSENNLCFKPGDMDGFLLCENDSKNNMVYIYYSEIDSVIEKLKNIKGDC